jgi:hypothetical protein
MNTEILFNVMTPLGFSVHTTKEHWNYIVETKHPIMENRLEDVISALSYPDEVRRSKSDKEVFLFYKTIKEKRWVCNVVKNENSEEGFLITTYITGAIKEGEKIWEK